MGYSYRTKSQLQGRQRSVGRLTSDDRNFNKPDQSFEWIRDSSISRTIPAENARTTNRDCSRNWNSSAMGYRDVSIEHMDSTDTKLRINGKSYTIKVSM